MCLSCSLWGHPVLQCQRKQSLSSGTVWRPHMQWGGKLKQSMDRWDRPAFSRRILCTWSTLQFFSLVLLQDSSMPTSATTCSAVWRSSSLNGAPATGTAVMTGNLCAAQMGSSTRTFVRWRCMRAETGHASSRSRCPCVLTVSLVGETLSYIKYQWS